MHRPQLKYHPRGKYGPHVGLSLVALPVNQIQWVWTQKMGTALIFTMSTVLPACYSTGFLFSVPPDRPVIYDSRRQVKTNIVEPYSEGSDIQLICEVKGGKDCSAKTDSLWLKSCATISRNSRSRFVCFVVLFPCQVDPGQTWPGTWTTRWSTSRTRSARTAQRSIICPIRTSAGSIWTPGSCASPATPTWHLRTIKSWCWMLIVSVECSRVCVCSQRGPCKSAL